MSGRYKETYHGSSGSAKLAATKFKRKAPCDDHDNPTPRPSNLPGMAASAPRVGRQLPNLAPKPEMVDPPSPPLMERALIPQHKRLRIDEHPQSSSQFLQQMHSAVAEQVTAEHRSDSNIPDVDPNALSMVNTSESSALAMSVDPLSAVHNTSQVETEYTDLPFIFQPPVSATFPEILQMSYPQASAVGFCPRCHAMWRNLRYNIMAFTFGQGLASGGVVRGELLQSYFGLEDHWKDGHASEVGLVG